MADAAIDLQASNLFGLNSNFKTQSSGTNAETTNPTAMDESGNVSCERVIEDITNYTQTAKYCGVDFVTDLGFLLTQFGDVEDGKIVTGITINMTAADYCTIDITGHNHLLNPHVGGLDIGYADVSDFLPHEAGEAFENWNGFGVPDFGLSTGANSSPSSATVTFAMNHVDEVDEAGDHLVGKNITPRCELSMDLSGIPSSTQLSEIESDLQANTNTMLGVLADTTDRNDSNSEFDSFSFTAHAHPVLATI